MANYYLGKTYPLGTQFAYGGVDYIIVGHARVNYKVLDRAGRRLTFKMYGVTEDRILPKQDEAWKKKALAPAEADTTFATLKEADPVLITGRGAGKFEGKTGYIAKINPATYGVLIPNLGIVNASKGLVKAAK